MRNEASARPWPASRLVLASGASLAGRRHRSGPPRSTASTGVPVDATAESGVAARELAIADGQREGLTRLMQRLTSPTAHGRLPDVPPAADRALRQQLRDRRGEGRAEPLPGRAQRQLRRRPRSRRCCAAPASRYVTRRSDPILVVPVDGGGRRAGSLARGEPLARGLVRRDRDRPPSPCWPCRWATSPTSRRPRRPRSPPATGRRSTRSARATAPRP